MLTAKSQEMVLARERGEKQADIAQRFDVIQQRVSAVVRQGTDLVNKVELDLMVARKTGEACVYVIPYGPDYQLALDFSDWLVRKLRDRELDIRVETRRASNGLALLLEDVTEYRA